MDAGADQQQAFPRAGQEDAAEHLARHFDADLTYFNDKGNRAISRPVLTAFRRISAETVVWDRTWRCWRLRKPSDPEGRQVD